MQVLPVDPRDAVFEDDVQAFRVHFWQQLQTPTSTTHVGMHAQESEILDADFEQVLRWARATAAGRTFVV